jgi:hypothetical protein
MSVQVMTIETGAPHDLDAEKATLAAILVDNSTYPAVSSLLQPRDYFRQPAHGLLLQKMGALYSRGEPIDLITLRSELGPELDRVGGPAYIASLVDGVSRSANVEAYAAKVKQLADVRRMLAYVRQAEQTFTNNPGELANGGGARFLEAVRGLVEGSHRSTLPAFETLRDRLARPVEPIQWAIEGWQARSHRVVTAAQFKSGKTVLVGNAIRARADGVPFLGCYRATALGPNETIALIDCEMSEGQLVQWYREQGIRNDDRVLVIPLRGRLSDFNILNPAVRSQWARLLKQHRVVELYFDCFRPLLDAIGLDEQKEAGRLLVAFDDLLDQAEISTFNLIHHMGHSGERSRGDSRLRDWPDVEWRLVRQDDDPASPRFISAYGRDVEIRESRLEFDPQTRHLTVAGGSRKDIATDVALEAVIAVLADSPQPMSGRAVKTALADTEHSRDAIEKALAAGVRNRRIDVEEGPRRARLYRVSQCPGVSRECTGTAGVSVPVSRAPIGAGHGTLDGGRDGVRI